MNTILTLGPLLTESPVQTYFYIWFQQIIPLIGIGYEDDRVLSLCTYWFAKNRIYFRKDHSVLCWSQGRTLWMTTMESLIRVRRLYNKYNREHLLSLSVYKIVLFPGVKYLNSVRSQFSYSRSVHWEREEKEMYFIQFFLVVLLCSCLYCAIPEYIRAQPTRDMKGRPVPLRFVKQTYSN